MSEKEKSENGSQKHKQPVPTPRPNPNGDDVHKYSRDPKENRSEKMIKRNK